MRGAGKATAEAMLRNHPASVLDHQIVRCLSRHHYHAMQCYHEGDLGTTPHSRALPKRIRALIGMPTASAVE